MSFNGQSTPSNSIVPHHQQQAPQWQPQYMQLSTVQPATSLSQYKDFASQFQQLSVRVSMVCKKLKYNLNVHEFKTLFIVPFNYEADMYTFHRNVIALSITCCNIYNNYRCYDWNKCILGELMTNKMNGTKFWESIRLIGQTLFSLVNELDGMSREISVNEELAKIIERHEWSKGTKLVKEHMGTNVISRENLVNFIIARGEK